MDGPTVELVPVLHWGSFFVDVVSPTPCAVSISQDNFEFRIPSFFNLSEFWSIHPIHRMPRVLEPSTETRHMAQHPT